MSGNRPGAGSTPAPRKIEWGLGRSRRHERAGAEPWARPAARSTAPATTGEDEHMSSGDRLGAAVIGAGYWGPNLIRNFRGAADWDLVAVCDLDTDRAESVVGARSGVDVTASLEELLARDDVDAVAIATPARTHQAI